MKKIAILISMCFVSGSVFADVVKGDSMTNKLRFLKECSADFDLSSTMADVNEKMKSRGVDVENSPAAKVIARESKKYPAEVCQCIWDTAQKTYTPKEFEFIMRRETGSSDLTEQQMKTWDLINSTCTSEASNNMSTKIFTDPEYLKETAK